MALGTVFSKDHVEICTKHFTNIPRRGDSISVEDAHGNSTVYGVHSVEWVLNESDVNSNVRVYLDVNGEEGWLDSIFPSDIRYDRVEQLEFKCPELWAKVWKKDLLDYAGAMGLKLVEVGEETNGCHLITLTNKDSLLPSSFLLVNKELSVYQRIF
jgi:hypothetical protein